MYDKLKIIFIIHIMYNSTLRDNNLIGKEKQLDHKDFVMGMVEKLIERAMHFKYLHRTRTAKEIAGEHSTTPPGNKRCRMSKAGRVPV